MKSPQFIIEDALSGILNTITGLNVYISNRRGARLFPYVTIRASLGGQLIVPASGVFEVPVELSYSDSATRTSQASFEANYFEIFAALYEESSTLKSRIEANANNLKVFMARINSQTPTIRTEKRAWVRGLILGIIATKTYPSTFRPSLDFSDYRNSQYIGAI
ncbi:hypothetical protein EBS02_12930 [bacterium]|nr:hypothetical protein [bacterium]